MKFLEYTRLNRLNDFLSHVNLGERTIKGCLEAYSCKHTGLDKRLSLSLEHEILDHLGRSSDTDSPSPADNLISRSSRKTLIYLVLTLYHMYPDYDFSSLLEDLYKALDEVVKLSECEIYSYNPDSDADPFLQRGAIWSFNFFFYNRKLKCVVSLRFCCLSNLVADEYLTDELAFEEDGEIFDNMDI
ncbi:hypothetical protein SOVF_001270 [Spinacia oleracea]|nr:hypothetical protein SOVF_001270 [Spinacia oleracea]